MPRAPAPRSRVHVLPSVPRLAKPATLAPVIAAVALAMTALAANGCGHPATTEDCNAIIAKSAELELRAQNITDPVVIQQRTEAVKGARGEELLKRCVGKRITDSALACVSRAGSPREVDKCLE